MSAADGVPTRTRMISEAAAERPGPQGQERMR
jgi:hypothetical protein